MTTFYLFRKGFKVTHTVREDGRHDVTIYHGPIHCSGTYSTIECLDVALDTLAMAVGPWLSATREGAR